MSHQRHHVSGKDLPRSAPAQKHRKKQNVNYHVNFCEYDGDVEKPNKRRHKRQDIPSRDDSSSSIETKKQERPRRRKHHRKSDPSDIHILKQKLDEIDTLREQIEVFQSIISSQDDYVQQHASDHKNAKWITSSCFSFLSALTCKKSKPEIIEIYGDSSKLSYDPDQYVFGKDNSNKRPRKKTIQRKKRELVRKDKEQDLARHHRITNNNTIVLPDNYGLSSQQSGDQSLMNHLNQKLEAQVHEIKEIKDTLKECINLLRESGFAEANRYNRPNFNYLLDEYIKLNRMAPTKFEGCYPSTYKEEGFLSLLNTNLEKRFEKASKECTNMQMRSTPIIESIESLNASKKISKTTVTTENESKFQEPVHEVYSICKSKKSCEVVLKVSPLRCGGKICCHKPPKSVTSSLSTYSVAEIARKRSKKINRNRKPVKFNMHLPKLDKRNSPPHRVKHESSHNVKPECPYHGKSECPYRCPDPQQHKRSCFSRFIRFIFCKCN